MSYDTSLDILRAALFDASERQDAVSDYYEEAKRYINSAYLDIMDSSGVLFDGVAPLKEDWPFLIKPASFVLEPPKLGLSVTVTAGSTSVTFSSAISDSVAGWFLRVDGNDDTFAITSHSAGSATATLDLPYTGGPSGTYPCILFKADYELPSDFKRFHGPLYLGALSGSRPLVRGLDFHEFWEKFPPSVLFLEVPSHFTLLPSGGKIRFNSTGRRDGISVRIDYLYVFRPPLLTFVSDEEPIIPREYRSILANAATYQILLSKNDDRALAYYKFAQTRLQNMIDDFRRGTLAGSDLGQIESGGFITSQSGVIFSWTR